MRALPNNWNGLWNKFFVLRVVSWLITAKVPSASLPLLSLHTSALHLQGDCSVPAEYIQVAAISFLSGSCSVETSGISSLHYGGCIAECKITAGHWLISDHFSKMANQNFSMVRSLCTHGQSNSSRIGKMTDHFKFLILHSAQTCSMS